MTRRSKSWRGPAVEAHVRMYKHELECPAYRALSPAARTLLVELRALYDVKLGCNRVYCSIRRMMERCNLTQRAAQRARDELIALGWIEVEKKGEFDIKTRHATMYALTNEAPNTGNGSIPKKTYMRWAPPAETENTACKENRIHGSRIDYRSVAESTTDAAIECEKQASTVAESTTDKPNSTPLTVVDSTTQISITSGRQVISSAKDSNSPESAPAESSHRGAIIDMWKARRLRLVARGFLPEKPERLSPAELTRRLPEFAPKSRAPAQPQQEGRRKPGPKPRFNQETIDAMRALHVEGASMATIAEHFGLGVGTVHRMIGQHRSGKTKFEPKQVDEMRGLLAAGTRMVDIARRFGTSATTVHRLIGGRRAEAA